jgi:hypothetical protein
MSRCDAKNEGEEKMKIEEKFVGKNEAYGGVGLKMRNKYTIIAVSLLVAFLFIGTAMTSAIAGSVVNTSQQTSSSAKATGCPLCAGSQAISAPSGSVPAIPNDPVCPDCPAFMLGAAIDVSISAITILITTIGTILQDPVFWSTLYNLLQIGYTVVQAIVLVVLDWLEDHPGVILSALTTFYNIIVVPFVGVITDPAFWSFVWNVTVAIGSILSIVLPIIIPYVIWGLGKLPTIIYNLANWTYNKLMEICQYLYSQQQGQSQPQELVLQDLSLSATSQVMIQNAVQAIAPSTQKLSALSPQSTSLVSKTGSTSALSRR